MKKFKVTFIKHQKVIGPGQGVPIMAEQIIITGDQGKIEIKPPDGFSVAVICELLPDLIINEKPVNNEKTNFN